MLRLQLPAPPPHRRSFLAGLLSALPLAGCLGTGFRRTNSETWVHPDLAQLGPQRYALLPVDCPEEVIPSDLYGPWRRRRHLELTLHLRRTLAERLKAAGHVLSDSGLVEAALGRGDLELPMSVRELDSERRAELARRLRADAVIETRVLDGSPERLTIALRAVHLSSGDLLWRSRRTDTYGRESTRQVERLVGRSLEALHERGL